VFLVYVSSSAPTFPQHFFLHLSSGRFLGPSPILVLFAPVPGPASLLVARFILSVFRRTLPHLLPPFPRAAHTVGLSRRKELPLWGFSGCRHFLIGPPSSSQLPVTVTRAFAENGKAFAGRLRLFFSWVRPLIVLRSVFFCVDAFPFPSDVPSSPF